MRVLHIDHTSLVSGAERSLLELLRAEPAAGIAPLVACPGGPLAVEVATLGLTRLALCGTTGSFKLHPLHTPRAGAEVLAMAVATRIHARAQRADVLHANTMQAGVVAVLARRLGAPPCVCHLRDALPDSSAGAAVRRLLRAADGLVAISRHTAECLSPEWQALGVRIVENAVDMTRFDPGRLDRGQARSALQLPADGPVLCMVAQITPWKAQSDAIRMLSALLPEFPTARLLLVGETKFVSGATRYDNRAYLASLHRLAEELGVGSAVMFLGERSDVQNVLAACDLALLPSWEEPFGRSMAEAMAMGLPVLATSVGGPAEVVVDGVTGRLLPPREPARWAAAAAELLGHPAARVEMGARARAAVAERFAPERHAAGMLASFRAAVGLGAG